MFGFSKKNEKEQSLADGINDMLKLNDSAFARLVSTMLQNSPPQACVMCVIAYQNLKPMLVAISELAKERPAGQLPTDLDSFILSLIPGLENPKDEIAERRLGWFLQAALITRASERGVNNANLDDQIVEIWISLANGAALLREVVEQNQLWEEGEKEWFNQIQDEKSGIRYCLNVLMPARYRQRSRIEEFARLQGVTLCAS